MFKKLLSFMALLFLLMSPSGLKAEDSSFKEDVRSTVSNTVDASKDFFSGVVEGITGTEDNGASPPLEPIQVVSNKLTLGRLLKVKVLQATEQKNGDWVLTVALRNNKDFQIKVTNMISLGQVAVLDGGGFASPLPNSIEQGADFVVLPRSAAKVRFKFNGMESRPTTFRLLGIDFPIPK